MAGADLFIVNGTASDYVTPRTNTTGQATPIMEISPDRGLFLRFLNAVAKGSERGMPAYGKFRDSGSAHLPANTSLYWALEVQGMEQPVKVSEKKGNVSFYISNDLTTQRDKDNVDGSKFILTEPETNQNPGPVNHINVRDIDAMYLMCESSTQIDWDTSEVYVDTNAVQQGER